mgnify:CR=1 FL=1
MLPLYQPANSPDTNIQDLAFFASLQADIRKVQKKTIGDLITAVEDCYQEYPVSLQVDPAAQHWVAQLSVERLL